MTRRRKQFEMDGAEFTISPLTLNQLEDHVKPVEDGQDPRQTQIRVVVAGLNNAAECTNNGSGFAAWTPERVRDEMDLILLNALFDAIMEFTTGRLVKEAAPGEASAVSQN